MVLKTRPDRAFRQAAVILVMQVLAEFIMEQVDMIFNINVFNLQRISTNYTKLGMEYTGYIKGNTDP